MKIEMNITINGISYDVRKDTAELAEVLTDTQMNDVMSVLDSIEESMGIEETSEYDEEVDNWMCIDKAVMMVNRKALFGAKRESTFRLPETVVVMASASSDIMSEGMFSFSAEKWNKVTTNEYAAWLFDYMEYAKWYETAKKPCTFDHIEFVNYKQFVIATMVDNAGRHYRLGWTHKVIAETAKEKRG